MRTRSVSSVGVSGKRGALKRDSRVDGPRRSRNAGTQMGCSQTRDFCAAGYEIHAATDCACAAQRRRAQAAVHAPEAKCCTAVAYSQHRCWQAAMRERGLARRSCLKKARGLRSIPAPVRGRAPPCHGDPSWTRLAAAACPRLPCGPSQNVTRWHTADGRAASTRSAPSMCTLSDAYRPSSAPRSRLPDHAAVDVYNVSMRYQVPTDMKTWGTLVASRMVGALNSYWQQRCSRQRGGDATRSYGRSMWYSV